MGNRDEALANLAAIDADEIAGDFYTFAARRAEILHCAAPWGFSTDGAIIQRLLRELWSVDGLTPPPQAP
jgi:hypothetical protein